MTSPVIYTCQEDDGARVRGVQLTLVDPEIVRRMSVVKITEPAIYDKNTPKKDGVYDHRMGVVVRRLACGTCGHMVDSCPGHIGSIELNHPVYHAHYINYVLKVLRCVCYYCSRFLMAPPWPQAPASGEPGGSCERDAAHATATGGGRAALGKARLTAACEAVKRGKARKACWNCAGPQPEYSIAKSSPLVIRANWAGVAFETDADRAAALAEPFSAREAHNILTLVPNEDYVRMGWDTANSHPSWMIITVLPVPPPIVRPSITETEGSRSRGQDDLTHKLKAIVQANNAIGAHRRASAANPSGSSLASTSTTTTSSGPTAKVLATPLADLVAALQVEVATYHNNDIRGQKQSTQRSGKPTKGLVERFKGKEGRVRGSLMGKRVNFTARAVITPDPEIDIDQVGVPYEIVKTLTFPERVTSFNIDDLTRRVRSGPDALGGAKTVTDHRSRTLYLEPRAPPPGHAAAALVSTMATGAGAHSTAGGAAWRVPPRGNATGADRAPPLQVGWVVERHLRDGDPVIMNRQPSLHMGSMMNHYVVPMPGRTMRLNLSVTSPYNADFDGDEMNLHAPQSDRARAEVAHIMSVPEKAVSPQANKAIIGLVMDALVGCGFLTANDVFLTRPVIMQLVTAMKYDAVGRGSRFRLPPPAIVRCVDRASGRVTGPLWTGKQMFSLLLPADVNFERRVRDVDSDADAMLHPERVWPSGDVVGHAANPYVARRVRDERVVVVQSGELLAGSVCKQTAGATTGGFVHVIFKDVSTEGVKRFLSDAQRVANRWLSWRGFSVGIQDCMPDPATRARVSHVVDRAMAHIDRVSQFVAQVDHRDVPSIVDDGGDDSGDSVTTREASHGLRRRRRRSASSTSADEDDPSTDGGDGGGDDYGGSGAEAPDPELRPPPRKRAHIAEPELEACVSRVANKVLDQVGRIVQASTDARSNAVCAMAMMGSKGTVFNIAQMCGGVGQQSNEGQRIHSEAGSRTLSCYRHAEAVPPPESRGFVRNSYERGLNQREMFLHMIGGREGLVDTAVKTAETGYIQRRCIKSMESLQVKRGGLVRNANGEIVQFAYGGDGIDATYIERVRCREVCMTADAIRAACRWTAARKHGTNRSSTNTGNGDASANRASAEQLQSPVWDQSEIDAAAAAEAERIIALRDEVLAMKSSLANGAGGGDDDQLFVAIHAARLVETVCRREAGRPCARGPISPLALNAQVDALCRAILAMAAEADVGASVAAAAKAAGLPPLRGTAGLRLVLACELRSRVIVHRWRATWTTWEAIWAEIAGDERRAGRYVRSLVSPGEMVGAIAGQSIGEPGTQMSVVYEERLLVAGPGGACQVQIGDLVENAVAASAEPLIERDAVHDTVHVDVSHHALTVPAVDADGVVRWRRLLGVTRHPPNGALVRVRTLSGRTVTATLAKSFLTLRDGRVTPIDGKDLRVGDVLPVNRRLPLWPCPAQVAKTPQTPSLFEPRQTRAIAKRSSAWEALASRDRHAARRHLNLVFGETMSTEVAVAVDTPLPSSSSLAACSLDADDLDTLMALAALTGDGVLVAANDKTVTIGPAPHAHGAGTAPEATASDGDDATGDVFWDEIVQLDIVADHGRDHVYDLTVEHDANFSLLSGLQMRDTLRTFHFAGCGAKNVTLGVPRLREIIDATLKMKRPCVTLHLDRRAPMGSTHEAALAVCRQIEHSTLATLVESYTIDAVEHDCNGIDTTATVANTAPDRRIEGEDDDNEGDDDSAFARICLSLFKPRPLGSVSAPTLPAPPSSEAPKARSKSRTRTVDSATADAEGASAASLRSSSSSSSKTWRPQAYRICYTLDRAATLARGLTPLDVARRVAESVGEFGRVTHAEAAMEAWFVHVLLDDATDLLARFRQHLPPRPNAATAMPASADAATAMPPPRPRSRAPKGDGGAAARTAAAAAASKATPEEAAEAARWERAALSAIQSAFMAAVRVSGVAGVTRAVPSEVTARRGSAESGETAPEWSIEVDGNALSELLCIPGVDASRSHSNDIHRVAAVLGIEAAVAVLFSEIKAVISFDGTYVNDRHFALATDTMCCRGSVVAVTRHGFNRADHGFLSRASFEETVDILFDAAAFAETDKITDGSVTEPIILGQAAPIGTAISDVLITEEYARQWRPAGSGAVSDRTQVVTRPAHVDSAASVDTRAPHKEHHGREHTGTGGAGSASGDRHTIDGRYGDVGSSGSDGCVDEEDEDEDMDLAEPLIDPSMASDLVPVAQSGTHVQMADDGCPRYAPPSPTLLLAAHLGSGL
ncbi:DNA-directed RNA polymerase ii subunit rpb 1 [Pandoravirus kuranda]|uniref:DNA-directed RNA polymerase subunit n=1 Tax=Pandoravirus kuranda TaxID=3019033 RepID=A0AA95EDW6_9VIRU|nr:DNA-directed RNA polymerase ii subunit rpb 1 [Pandoravirus kuranda]